MIYFLTVNYYSKELIKNLIDSIEFGIRKSCQILIVNNSPEEADIHDLACDRISIIESGGNLGFGKACNLGIQHVYQADPTALVWLINPDATLDAGADEYIQSCLLSYPSLAILGTQIRSSTGEIWFVAGIFNPWIGYINHKNIKSYNANATDKVSSTDWVSGCSLILNLKQFKQCPTFDPSYFLYFEDADLCERYSGQGYIIAITNRAVVTHQVSAIIGKNIQFMFRHYTFGRLLFLWRYATPLGFCIYFLYLIAKIITLLIKNPENAKGRWQGITAFFAHNRSDSSAKA